MLKLHGHIFLGDGAACACCAVADKKSMVDPTGTEALRSKMRGTINLRWRKLRVIAKQIIVDHDLLQIANGGLLPVKSPAIIGGATKVQSFQRWFDQALNLVVLGGDGSVMRPMLSDAYDLGVKFAARQLGKEGQQFQPAGHVKDTIFQLAVIELQGVMEAVSQQSVRAVANALLVNGKPATIVRQIYDRIEAIGVVRTNAMVNMLIVTAFNHGALDAYEAAGIAAVGLIAETLPPKRTAISDAPRRKGPGSRISRKKPPSERTIRRIRAAQRRLELLGKVNVRTAGDDDVCIICEDIAAAGPYPIDVARSLIPAHPHCRCAFVPAHDARFAQDSFNPNQKRDPAGSHTGGQWTSAEADLPEGLKERSGTSIELGGEIGPGGRRRPAAAHEIQIVGPDGTVHYRMEIIEERKTAEKLPRDLFPGTAFGIGFVENVSQKYKGLGESMYKIAARYAERHGGALLAGGNLKGEHSQNTINKLLKSGHAVAFEAFGKTLYRISSTAIKHDAYNPDQPRDPGGEHGGEWTSSFGPSGMTEDQIKRMIAKNDERIAELSESSSDDPTLEREVSARDAMNSVLKNDLKAHSNPALATHTVFRYKGPIAARSAAIQYSIKGQQMDVAWLGSTRKGDGAALLTNAIAHAKRAGVKKVKIDAKWGSKEFYKKHGFTSLGVSNALTNAESMELNL